MSTVFSRKLSCLLGAFLVSDRTLHKVKSGHFSFGYENIGRLIDYALKNSLILSTDVYVARNMFMEALALNNWQNSSAEYSGEPVDEVSKPLVDYT